MSQPRARENFFAQAVAVARCRVRVIRRTVALDSAEIAGGRSRIGNGKVDEEAHRADLEMHLEAKTLNNATDGAFKLGVWLATRAVGRVGQATGFGELEVIPQVNNPVVRALRSRQNLIRFHAAHNDRAQPRPTEQAR